MEHRSWNTFILSRCFLFCLCFLLTYRAFGQSVPGYSAEDVLDGIAASEKQLRTMESHLDFRWPDGTVWSLDWGHQGGKEYLWGKAEMPEGKFNGTPYPKRTLDVKWSFDGEKLYKIQHDSALPNYYSGTVQEYSETLMTPFLRPTTLLGYDAVIGPGSLSCDLRNAEKVAVKNQTETIDGHQCTVIEAIGAGGLDETKKRNLRVWIDPSRDFRPLKIEWYRNFDPNKPWKILNGVVDGIKLEQIDSIWFPVEGKRHIYLELKNRPPEGMSEAEFTRLPWEKRREIIVIPTATDEDRLQVSEFHKDTIRLNKGIDPKKFKPEFPQGCVVYDAFADTIYKVGSLMEESTATALKSVEGALSNNDSNKPEAFLGKRQTSRPNEEAIAETAVASTDNVSPRASFVIYLAPLLALVVVLGVWTVTRKRVSKCE